MQDTNTTGSAKEHRRKGHQPDSKLRKPKGNLGSSCRPRFSSQRQQGITESVPLTPWDGMIRLPGGVSYHKDDQEGRIAAIAAAIWPNNYSSQSQQSRYYY